MEKTHATTVVGKEIVNVTKDMGNLIGDAITTLAEKLSVPAQHVYEVLVKQYYYEAIAFMIITSALIIVFSIVSIVAGITAFSLIFTILIGAINFPYKFAQMMNPEYYAIQEIMAIVKNIK